MLVYTILFCKGRDAFHRELFQHEQLDYARLGGVRTTEREQALFYLQAMVLRQAVPAIMPIKMHDHYQWAKSGKDLSSHDPAVLSAEVSELLMQADTEWRLRGRVHLEYQDDTPLFRQELLWWRRSTTI